MIIVDHHVYFWVFSKHNSFAYNFRLSSLVDLFDHRFTWHNQFLTINVLSHVRNKLVLIRALVCLLISKKKILTCPIASHATLRLRVSEINFGDSKLLKSKVFKINWNLGNHQKILQSFYLIGIPQKFNFLTFCLCFDLSTAESTDCGWVNELLLIF